MGAAELGFNLCHETPDTVRLRQLAASDERLCHALFGHVDTVPIIAHYDPRRWFIELAPTSDPSGGGSAAFAFTNVDLRAAMPLIRYQTGDCGYLLSRAHLSRILCDFNYETYVPRLTLPIMAVAGRMNESITAAGQVVRMEFLRSLLYSDRTLASQITGQFQALAAGDTLRIDIQVDSQTGADRIATVQKRFSGLINQYIQADVRVVPYLEFRHGMGVDYERKFSHLVR
jgi:phenylacetate-CoA ligase